MSIYMTTISNCSGGKLLIFFPSIFSRSLHIQSMKSTIANKVKNICRLIWRKAQLSLIFHKFNLFNFTTIRVTIEIYKSFFLLLLLIKSNEREWKVLNWITLHVVVGQKLDHTAQWGSWVLYGTTCQNE